MNAYIKPQVKLLQVVTESSVMTVMTLSMKRGSDYTNGNYSGESSARRGSWDEEEED